MSDISKSDSKELDAPRHVVSANEVDEAAIAVGDDETPLDPEEALRLRRKIDRHILPLMMILYAVQFIDKTTLGNSSILGIRESAHLDASQYNWLGTIFYISYLAFEYPQNLALQRFPVAKWMSFNILVWAIVLCCHSACHSFGSLFALRFILGICEGSITAGFLIVTSMFWTHKEQGVRVGWWFLMNGTAQIMAGFISFGVLHISSDVLEPWQWYFLITGIITVFVAVGFWFLFPNNPQTAWFLTPEERVVAIKRIRVNQSGVENKHFKKEQFIEALTDPKTWLFAFFSAVCQIQNSLTNQRQLIVHSFGFTVLQTTLLAIVDGAIEIISIGSAVLLAARLKNARGYLGALIFLPAIVGSICLLTLPWTNKVGLLISLFVSEFSLPGFVIVLGWITAVTAGHTKRVTVNAILLMAYCLGNICGPQMWQAQYAPRYHVPWTVILVSVIICPLTLLVIRFYLARENAKRDREAAFNGEISGQQMDDNYYVSEKQADGTVVQRHVDKAFMDLTDIQNRDFRYAL